MKKGTIALDIDGTITAGAHELPQNVKLFLEKCVEEGWVLYFLTGRTFSFAHSVVSALECPYVLGVQNGASLWQLPENRCLARQGIGKKSLPFLEKTIGKGLLLESGKENGDVCYYKRSDFSLSDLEYLKVREKLSLKPWVNLTSFEELPVEEIAIVKYFSRTSKEHQLPGFNHITTRDPFRVPYFLTLISHEKAGKDLMLNDVLHPLIVAGDDFNDEKMIQRGDVKIVMGDAPEPLKRFADIIAKPAAQEGIIDALKEAMRR